MRPDPFSHVFLGALAKGWDSKISLHFVIVPDRCFVLTQLYCEYPCVNHILFNIPECIVVVWSIVVGPLSLHYRCGISYINTILLQAEQSYVIKIIREEERVGNPRSQIYISSPFQLMLMLMLYHPIILTKPTSIAPKHFDLENAVVHRNWLQCGGVFEVSPKGHWDAGLPLGEDIKEEE